MLVTQERHRIKNSLYLLEKGDQLWDIVHLELSLPYFFVNYEIDEGDVSIGQQAVLWQPHALLAFCDGIKDSKNKRLTGVSLLLPPYISDRHCWDMIALKEIWLASHKEQAKRFFIYVDEAGKRYADQDAGDVSDASLDKIETYFRVTPDQPRHPA